MNVEEHHKKSHHCDDSEDYSYTSTPVGTGNQALPQGTGAGYGGQTGSAGQIPTGTGSGSNTLTGTGGGAGYDNTGGGAGYDNTGSGYNNPGSQYDNTNTGGGYDNTGSGYDNTGSGYNNSNSGSGSGYGSGSSDPGYESSGTPQATGTGTGTGAFNSSVPGVGGNTGSAHMSTGQKIASAIPFTSANREKKALQENRY